MSDTVPDVAGVIVGWRTWRVAWDEDYGTNPVLLSRVTWPLDGSIEAKHHGSVFLPSFGEGEPHDAPEKHCMCGIYAVPQATDLVGQTGAAQGPMLVNGRAVAGKVALWGKVIEHSNGWRAQYAKPLALALPPEPSRTLLDVQERYGLPSVDDEGLFAAHERYEAVAAETIQATITAQAAEFADAMRKAEDVGRRAGEAGAAFRDVLRAAVSKEFRHPHTDHVHSPWSYHKGGRP